MLAMMLKGPSLVLLWGILVYIVDVCLKIKKTKHGKSQ